MNEVYKMERNAIIMDAGQSNRFAPFSYEKPKGLFIGREEVLIERQIEQLLDAGANDIVIVLYSDAEIITGCTIGLQDKMTMIGHAYYGRELTDLEHRYAIDQLILNAFNWISWSLFKGSVGEEDGFFFLTSYRNIIDNIDDVNASYGVIS